MLSTSIQDRIVSVKFWGTESAVFFIENTMLFAYKSFVPGGTKHL